MTETADRRAWRDSVALVASKLGMPDAPTVEFADGAGVGWAARYDHVRDVLIIRDGWINVEPDPRALASRALIAHELGHRLDRRSLTRARRFLLAVVAVAFIAFVTVLAKEIAASWSTTTGLAAPSTLAVFMPALVGVPMIALITLVKWPFELRADAIAARLYGPSGVHAFLDVLVASGGGRIPSPTHPSARMRRNRHRAVE